MRCSYLRPLCAIVLLAAPAGLSGCSKPPDPEQYGEIITTVPPHLNKPFPMPELEIPKDEDVENAAAEPAEASQNNK